MNEKKKLTEKQLKLRKEIRRLHSRKYYEKNKDKINAFRKKQRKEKKIKQQRRKRSNRQTTFNKVVQKINRLLKLKLVIVYKNEIIISRKGKTLMKLMRDISK